MGVGNDPLFRQQFERVRRWYGRFKNHCDGKPVEMPCRVDPDYMDDIHAFFQNCYHLKDWLKNDPEFTKWTNQEIEDFVTSTPLACDLRRHLQWGQTPDA